MPSSLLGAPDQLPCPSHFGSKVQSPRRPPTAQRNRAGGGRGPDSDEKQDSGSWRLPLGSGGGVGQAVAAAAPEEGRGEAQEHVLDFVETQLRQAAQTQTGHHGGLEWPSDPKHVGAAECRTSRSGQRQHDSSRTRTGSISEASHNGTRRRQETGRGTEPDCANDPAANRRYASDCLDPAYVGAAGCIQRGGIFGQHTNLEVEAIRRRWAKGDGSSSSISRSGH